MKTLLILLILAFSQQSFSYRMYHANGTGGSYFKVICDNGTQYTCDLGFRCSVHIGDSPDCRKIASEAASSCCQKHGSSFVWRPGGITPFGPGEISQDAAKDKGPVKSPTPSRKQSLTN